MHFLLRLFTGLFLVWLVCYFFYSLGRKSAFDESKKKQHFNNKRKKVDSSVVEEEKGNKE